MGYPCNKFHILLICLSLTILLVTLQFAPYFIPTTQAIWTYPSGYDPHGGYVDRITFKIYPSEDLSYAIQDLQVGGVYSYDDEFDPFWFGTNELVEIAADPNIEVTSEPGPSYRQMTLNCQRFPTNLTGYRVALAYALDKHLVVENARGGFAQVMDNPVPLAFEFWSFETQMASHFYAEDISSANATLDAAHIID
ncbi:MAG: ABC transporter substrate-binding protein, partial [Candidatus Thorarchaeota archaeon]